MNRDIALSVPAKAMKADCRCIGLLAYEDAEILDIAGPLEVFACADRWLRRWGIVNKAVYRIDIFAKRAGPVRTSANVQIIANRKIGKLRNRLDTLIVVGGDGFEKARCDAGLKKWLRGAIPKARRVASVCTGAFILAEIGTLDGKSATTHWDFCKQLADQFPTIRVEPDRVFVREGGIYTSAGVTAGMDLALALLAEDWGRDVALYVARRLVLFLQRPGGQSQFSSHLALESGRHEPLRAIQRHILSHPAEDHSVPRLAERAAMSPRNFARVFLQETGMTPAKYVERVRVDAARIKLEQTSLSIDVISSKCGFDSPERMRRAFIRCLRIGPKNYREHFRENPGPR